jgi:hypothetical protein
LRHAIPSGNIGVSGKYKQLQKKPHRGNHFGAKGCRVDTVGLDAEMIRVPVAWGFGPRQLIIAKNIDIHC